MANAVIFLFLCAIYGYFVRQTRAAALRHGAQNTIMLEKLRKYSALFAIGILRLYLEMDISYLCKTEKEINNIVVGDRIIKQKKVINEFKFVCRNDAYK